MIFKEKSWGLCFCTFLAFEKFISMQLLSSEFCCTPSIFLDVEDVYAEGILAFIGVFK